VNRDASGFFIPKCGLIRGKNLNASRFVAPMPASAFRGDNARMLSIMGGDIASKQDFISGHSHRR